MTLSIGAGVLLILAGAFITWASLRGLNSNRTKPRQRIDPSVFAVMELQALEFHPKSVIPTTNPRSRRDSLNLEAGFKDIGSSSGTTLFGKPANGSDKLESPSSSTLHIRSMDVDSESDHKTLGL